MTFLYEYNVLNKLLKIGQDANLPVPNPGINMIVLENLLSQLSSQVSSEEYSISNPYTSTKDSELTMDDLRSLDHLIFYVMNDGINVNGKFIAISDTLYPTSVEAKNLESEYVGPIAINPGLGYKVYIHKTLFPEFINYLQKQAQKSKNKLFESALAQIGNEFKSKNIEGLSYSKEPQKALPSQEISDSTQIDSLPEILNISDTNQAGTKPLFYKDIKSADVFTTWLKSNNIKIAYTVGGKQTEIPTSDKTFDNCYVVRYMYTRAKAMVSQYSNDTKYQYYLKAIESLAQNLKDPSGKQCSLYTVQTVGPDPQASGYRSDLDKTDGSKESVRTQSITRFLNRGLWALSQDGLYPGVGIQMFKEFVSLFEPGSIPVNDVSDEYAKFVKHYEKVESLLTVNISKIRMSTYDVHVWDTYINSELGLGTKFKQFIVSSKEMINSYDALIVAIQRYFPQELKTNATASTNLSEQRRLAQFFLQNIAMIMRYTKTG